MGVIFKHNNQLIQCRNLQKKLKKLRINESDIEIVKSDIPDDVLEKTFVEMTRGGRIEDDNIPQWKLDGRRKAIYINLNKDSDKYLYSFVRFPYKDADDLVFEGYTLISNQNDWDELGIYKENFWE